MLGVLRREFAFSRLGHAPPSLLLPAAHANWMLLLGVAPLHSVRHVLSDFLASARDRGWQGSRECNWSVAGRQLRVPSGRAPIHPRPTGAASSESRASSADWAMTGAGACPSHWLAWQAASPSSRWSGLTRPTSSESRGSGAAPWTASA
jgi:hypothetical protein